MSFKIIYGSSLDECLKVDKTLTKILPDKSLFVTDVIMLRDQLSTVPCSSVVITNESLMGQWQLDDLIPIIKNVNEIDFYSYINGSLNKILTI